MAKYRIKADVPDNCVPFFLTKGKIYTGTSSDRYQMTELIDDEGDVVTICHSGGLMFHPYSGNPLEEVK